MKFPIKKFCLIFILIAVLMMSCSLTIGAQTAVNDDDAFFESYTYWNDIIGGNSKTAVYMQPIYRASNVLSVSNIVGEEINTLSDIYSDKNGYTYLLDSEASAIFILDSDYHLVNKINSLKSADGNDLLFNGARSLYVTSDGTIYLCGTKNACVWILNQKGEIKNTHGKRFL